jgi:lipopolysaccharide export system protein LptA
VKQTSSRIAFAVLGLAAVVAAGWLVHWSVKRTREEAEVATAPRRPALRTPQAKIIQPRLEAYDEQGERTWTLRLDEAELGRGGDHVSGAGLREGVIYDPQTGEGIVRVVGDTVSYNLATKNFELTGNVRIVNDEGLVLTMERASYIEAEKKLICTDDVVGRDEDVVVTTDKAFYWPHENVVQCPGEVRCQTGDGTELFGRDLRVDFETKKLTMAGVSGRINLEEAESRMESEDRG